MELFEIISATAAAERLKSHRSRQQLVVYGLNKMNSIYCFLNFSVV
jgi:hypothetical protein